MKKIAVMMLGVLSLLTAMVVSAAEPENFIPKDAAGIVRFDVRRAIARAQAESALSNTEVSRDFQEFLAEAKAVLGMDISELFASDIWMTDIDGTGKKGAAYFKTTLPEEKLAAIFQAGSTDDDVDLSISEIGGRKAYIITNNDDNNSIAIIYLVKDVILCTENGNNSASVLNASLLNGGGNALLADINRQTLASAVINLKQFGDENLNTIKATFDLTGATQDDIFIQVNLDCKDAQNARAMAMQAQMGFPGLVGMLFSNDEKLAQQLIAGFKVKAENKTIVATYALNRACIEQAVQYLSNPANHDMGTMQESVEP